MNTIEATYRIVTPMFIGGADQSPSDGIRPPSFKGALRFWWRALHWGNFLQDASNDEAQALQTLHQKEAELFGSAAQMKNGKQVGGQGSFLLKIEQAQHVQFDDKWPAAKPLKGSGYLGIGLWESGSKDKDNFQAHRKSMASTTPFKVTLLLNQRASGNDKEQLCRSLKALGLFGGL
ncbi:MAG: type III-B CRISPR module RAMP protein Cmr1, partial [Mariprofundales bacterium]|nr:type III-B CRISPR module RAMP protein Cmr1 [Mariprofundales bacterium]